MDGSLDPGANSEVTVGSVAHILQPPANEDSHDQEAHRRAIDVANREDQHVSPAWKVCFFLTIVFVISTRRSRKPRGPTSVPVDLRGQAGSRQRSHTRSPRFKKILASPTFRTISTKIRGVTKPNDEGMNRQRIIRQCCDSGDTLYLEREPTNPPEP